MFHPVVVVAVGIILAGMGATAFGAVEGAGETDNGLFQKVVEFQGLHQIAVPDQRTVVNGEITVLPPYLFDLGQTICHQRAATEDRGEGLHAMLQLKAKFRRGGAAAGVSGLVHAGQGVVSGILGQGLMGGAGGDDFGAAQGRGAAEHHEIKQRIGAQPVGAVHRDTGRLADGHEPRRHGVGIVLGGGQNLAVNIGGDAAHVVMHRGLDGDGLAGDIHVGEDFRRFGNSRQAFMQHRRVDMAEIEMHMVLLGATTAPFLNLHGDGTADHVA